MSKYIIFWQPVKYNEVDNFIGTLIKQSTFGEVIKYIHSSQASAQIIPVQYILGGREFPNVLL